jgi:hypothetical protein
VGCLGFFLGGGSCSGAGVRRSARVGLLKGAREQGRVTNLLLLGPDDEIAPLVTPPPPPPCRTPTPQPTRRPPPPLPPPLPRSLTTQPTRPPTIPGNGCQCPSTNLKPTVRRN